MIDPLISFFISNCYLLRKENLLCDPALENPELPLIASDKLLRFLLGREAIQDYARVNSLHDIDAGLLSLVRLL